MNRMTMKKQRRVLRGWIKWVPVVAIPFSILFFHAWLNIQILRADYVLRELDAEARQWADRLNHTGMAETIHEDPNLLADQAEQMAFVQPSPWQREVVPYDPSVPLLMPSHDPITMAKGHAAPQPDPAASESLSERGAIAEAGVPLAPARTAPEIAPSGVAPIVAVQPAATTAPVAAVTGAPEAAPATDGFAETVPMTSTPVSLPLEIAPAAPAAVNPDVVLELPEDAYIEDLVALEGAMESLESL